MAKVTKKLQKEEIAKIKTMVKGLEVFGVFDPSWEDFDKALVVLRAIQLQAGFIAELMEASKAQRKAEIR